MFDDCKMRGAKCRCRYGCNGYAVSIRIRSQARSFEAGVGKSPLKEPPGFVLLMIRFFAVTSAT